MSKKGKQWCAVPGCMSSINIEERHFFRFPKEHGRWLEWIKASKRLDLELKGPNYAYQNCTLCHLHFEEKWLRKTTVIRLHPDAIPTIFFGPAFDRENINKRPMEEIKTVQEVQDVATIQEVQEVATIQEVQEVATVQEGNKSDVQCLENPLINVDAKAEPSTSSSTHPEKNNSSDKSPRKKKLHMQILKLKRQNNKLRQMVRQLRLKQEKQKRTTENQEINDINNMRQLGDERTLLASRYI